MLSSTTRNVTRKAINLAVAAVLALGAVTATADKAEAYSAAPNPTISCLANILEIQGRWVTGSPSENVHSRFFIYRWNGNTWQNIGTTAWARLDVGPSRYAFNQYAAVLADGHYAAYEQIAAWNGAQWVYDNGLSKLKSNYPGSGFYATC